MKDIITSSAVRHAHTVILPSGRTLSVGDLIETDKPLAESKIEKLEHLDWNFVNIIVDGEVVATVWAESIWWDKEYDNAVGQEE